MSSNAITVTGKVRDKPYIWNDEATKTLLNVCLQYQKTHGVDQPFIWADIAAELEVKIGNKFPPGKLKNKFDHMKKLWRLWKELRQGETGIGWDPVNGRIIADETWWDTKIKEKEDYKKFRRKGIPPELDELWDKIFGSIVATGQYCVTPSMDPGLLLEAGEAPTQDVATEDINDDGSESENEYANLLDINLDAPDGVLLSNIQEHLTNSNPSGNAKKKGACTSKITKDSSKKTSSVVGAKRQKKGSTAAQQYNDHLALIDQTGQKMLSFLEADAASSAPPKEKFTLDDAMNAIEELVNANLLELDSILWCFAISEMMKEQCRQLFLTIKHISGRLAWLKYMYAEAKGSKP